MTETKGTHRVSSELLNDALDILASNNGLQTSDLARELNVSDSAASAAVRDLLNFGCISEGAVQYFRKDNEVTLKRGYFYEKDLPDYYNTPRSRQEKSNSKRSD